MASDAIPAAELRRLKETRLPAKRHAFVRKRRKKIEEHLEELRADFSEQPEICYYHATQIVKIRRGIEPVVSFSRFSFLWSQESRFLLRHLNSRWILSAVDTFADHGESGQREAAMAVASFANMLRFAETDRYLRRRTETHSLSNSSTSERSVDLWDGIPIYNVRSGDGLYNFVNRFRRVVGRHPVIKDMFDELIDRAVKHKTFIGDFVEKNRKVKIV